MPVCQGRRLYLVSVFFVLAGSAGAEPPTPLAKKVETEKKRDSLAERATLPRAVTPELKESKIAVRHLDQRESGWDVAESDHFRVYHVGDPSLARTAAVAAERARAAAWRKWFADDGPEWGQRGEILVFPTARDYSNATGAPTRSPGHSEIRADGNRVVLRRIHLHADEPSMIEAVLPHEVTHAVLAGQFGEQPVPRWADEGMAVLDEPRERIDRHLRALTRQRDEGLLFSTRELIRLKDYPEPRRMWAFYAQSVSLVEFLTGSKDSRTLARFVRDGLRDGYETSLRRYYGWSFEELDRRWRKHVFQE
ncbi:MAG TPA: hypothetical protein VKE94_05820 [Gemmataceae bacterium]|nr:hypothetical protein [Gemmataceae bacterium]